MPGHPTTEGVTSINYIGGIEPVATQMGDNTIIGTLPGNITAGIAHQEAEGRVIAWGDEWLTFDSDWQGYADVEKFWSQMINWVKPEDFCVLPQ